MSMSILKLLKTYNISTTCEAAAVQDVTHISVPKQRRLIKELFTGLNIVYPNKNYLIELTLKYIVSDIVTNQQTIPFSNTKLYRKAVNQAKTMGKESIYAKYILSTQKAKRQKRKVKS